MGKLFVRRAAFEINVAAAGRAHLLQKRKFTRCGINTYSIHIEHNFCISHSAGTFNAILISSGGILLNFCGTYAMR